VALIVLDAGVVIAFLDSSDAHHAAAKAALARLVTGNNRLILPVSAYAEVLVAPSALSASAVKAVEAALKGLGIQINDATPSIAKRAAALRAKHPGKLRLPDALVIATADELGADLIITTDRRWPRLTTETQTL
jgi:predicted nucleic acid-binding protein